jgi:6-pyruvoyl-tetrahydropterin synthase
MDFAEVDACCKPTIDALDHTTLNDRLAAPTAERLAEFLFHAFSRRLPGHVELVEVDVRETDRGGAIYP